MLVGLGIDVASVTRVERAVNRFGDRFTARVLTGLELEQLARRADRSCFVAGRFAVKEAAFKALGGPRDVGWHDLEVDAGPRGAPLLRLRGAALPHADRLGVSRVWVSITHDAGVAAAVVVLESS
ncbi:MAG: holo-ACP synthase [Polyangiaceae bacterium]|nr:holo-ACP synthase [Polyangiaceae bacterium]